jgi:Spy/CpxP family protein refolding chaperone
MMTMKKGMRITVIAVAVVFLASSFLYAQDNADTEALGKAGKIRQEKPILKALNLTAEQQKELEANRQTQRQEMTRIVGALKVQKEKLEQAMKNYSVTRTEVEPIVSVIKSLQAQLIDQRISGIFTVKGILSPEQFAKFQEIVGHKGKKMQRPGFGRQKNWMHGPGNQGE